MATRANDHRRMLDNARRLVDAGRVARDNAKTALNAARLVASTTSTIDTGSGFDAGRNARRLSRWAPTRENINSLLIGAGDTVIARARHLVRNNPYAANAMESFVANAVGTGIRPSSAVNDKDAKQVIQEAWARWVEEADADGVTNLYGMQQLATRALFEAGECFVRFRPRRPEDVLSVPLQVQLLEAEQLPYNVQPTNMDRGNTVRLGIEFSPIGKRVAYHFLAQHPGDVLALSTGLVDAAQTRRIPAEEILHLYRPLRPGQIRGQSHITSTMVKMFLLDQCDDAELERKKVAAMFAGFIRKPQNDSDPLGETPTTEDGIAVASLEPGTLQVLLPGEEIVFSEPTDVGGSYEAFQYRALTSIAAGVGIPYFNLTGDLRAANYSSMRAGLVEFRRRMEQFQQLTLVFQFCRPVWRRWFDTAVLAGAFEAPGYIDDRESWLNVRWIAPRYPWVDPLKDRQAEALALRIGTKSRTQAAREEGIDIEELDREIAMDKEREAELGLAFDTGAGSSNTAGNPKDETPGSDAPPAQEPGDAVDPSVPVSRQREAPVVAPDGAAKKPVAIG